MESSILESALVSIIIPVYNVENYISKCIESVIHQTYRNIEIILVDDGTPDRSGEICDEYSKKDDRIKVYHNENVGVSGARNFGIGYSNGQYLYFLDSDDYISPNCISYSMDKMLSYGAECVFTQLKIVYDDLGVEVVENHNIEILSGKEVCGKILTGKIKSYVNGKLFDKKLFKNVSFPVGRIYEDEATIYKACVLANKVVISEDVLGFYRMQPISITHLNTYSGKGLVHQFENFYEQYIWGKDNYLELRDFLFEKAVYCSIVACNQQAKGYTMEKYIHDDMINILEEYDRFSNKGILKMKKRIQAKVVLKHEKLYVFILSWILRLSKKHFQSK